MNLRSALRAHRFDGSKKARLAKIPTKPAHDVTKDDMHARLEPMREELSELEAKLHAEGKRGLLVVFQALDAAGKDGTVRDVFSGMNPQGVQVHAFKQPSAEERMHDYLWRIHAAAPARGMISVFNRSHYEDVTAVRVEKIAPDAVWKKRFGHINDFERMLNDEGIVVLKFFLHISKDEQRKRFEKRLENPHKHWKFTMSDVEKRKKWNAYTEAFEDMISRCATKDAPWYVIPADDKEYRNLLVARCVLDTLKGLDPQYPKSTLDLSTVKIPR